MTDCWNWLRDYWLNDTPAVHGLERIFLYGLLLAVSLLSPIARPPIGDSPLQAPELLSNTNMDLFFERRGLVGFLPKRLVNYDVLDRVRRVVLVSWVFVILGIFGHAPVIITAFGFFFLEMIKVGCFGVGHRWYLVVYMLLFLCFSNSRKTYSLDAYILEHVNPNWPFNPAASHPVFYSGLSTKLCLFASSFTLWSGALAKLVFGGFRWLNGSTLSWQVLTAPFGAMPLMKKLFLNKYFAAFSATLAVLFEACAILIPFPMFRSFRPIWLLCCFKFHFVIYLTMNPNYLPQSITYVPSVFTLPISVATLEPTLPSLINFFSNLETKSVPILSLDSFTCGCLVFASLVTVLLALVAVLGVESWPLSCIPMYAYYRGHLLPTALKAVEDRIEANTVGLAEDLLLALAHEYRTINPRCIGWLDGWVDLVVMRVPNVAGVKRDILLQGASPEDKKSRKSRARLQDDAGAPAACVSLRSYFVIKHARRSAYRLALATAVCETLLWNQERGRGREMPGAKQQQSRSRSNSRGKSRSRSSNGSNSSGSCNSCSSSNSSRHCPAEAYLEKVGSALAARWGQTDTQILQANVERKLGMDADSLTGLAVALCVRAPGREWRVLQWRPLCHN